MNNYGVQEVNPMPKDYHEEELEYIGWEELRDVKGIKAERIRFLSDPGFPYWDLSYFHIRIDGKKFEVLGSPFGQVPKKGFKSYIYKVLRNQGIFIDGFFDCISTLN